jgi:putative ABC transport system ATP-binding protein
MEITLQNLYKEFFGKLILSNINYKFLPNRLIGITGKSGAGKTTLINCIGLLEPITKGRIYYDNRDVTKIKNSLRQKYYKDVIGFLFQNNGLIDSWNANANLDIGLEFIRKSK